MATWPSRRRTWVRKGQQCIPQLPFATHLLDDDLAMPHGVVQQFPQSVFVPEKKKEKRKEKDLSRQKEKETTERSGHMRP
jgi:hypothetical protein